MNDACCKVAECCKNVDVCCPGKELCCPCLPWLIGAVGVIVVLFILRWLFKAPVPVDHTSEALEHMADTHRASLEALVDVVDAFTSEEFPEEDDEK